MMRKCSIMAKIRRKEQIKYDARCKMFLAEDRIFNSCLIGYIFKRAFQKINFTRICERTLPLKFG